MNKNILTTNRICGYDESLKTITPAFAPVRFCDFFIFAKRRMRAENIQYQPKHCVIAFSESATSQFCVAYLKKGLHKMTNTTESTIQTLYRYYNEMKETWYKGQYTFDQEEVYGKVFNAINDAIIKLPAQCEEDKQIKYKYIKEILTSYTDKITGMNKDIYDTINSLAAE